MVSAARVRGAVRKVARTTLNRAGVTSEAAT